MAPAQSPVPTPIPAPISTPTIAQGEHLTHRCQGWSDDMDRLRGWAQEVA